MNTNIESFVDALISLDRVAAQQLFENYSQHSSSIEFIEKIVVVSLEHIGEKWIQGTYALSQVYMAGRICEELIESILPLATEKQKKQAKIAICVLSDYHGLGKTIVYSLLRASGVEIIDFGFIDEDELIHKIEEEDIEIILISVLMLPSALKIKTVKEKIIEKQMNVKIIVGGAPFRLDNTLWEEVGADAMCETASQTISTIEKVLEER